MLTTIRWWCQPPARSTQFLKMWKESRYILQLSFQSMPGVTTMAISAEIYPSMVRGTGAGISAACGKVGATVGSYSFSELKKLVAIQGWCCFVALHRILAFLLSEFYMVLVNLGGITWTLMEFGCIKRLVVAILSAWLSLWAFSTNSICLSDETAIRAISRALQLSILRNQGHIDAIFWTVTGTSIAAMVLTLVAIPFYNGHTIDAADKLARNCPEIIETKIFTTREQHIYRSAWSSDLKKEVTP